MELVEQQELAVLVEPAVHLGLEAQQDQQALRGQVVLVLQELAVLVELLA